jgi:hypothetical protein
MEGSKVFLKMSDERFASSDEALPLKISDSRVAMSVLAVED